MIISLGLFMSRAILTAIHFKTPNVRSRLAFSGLAVNVATDVAISGLILWKIGRGYATHSPRTQRALRRLRNITIEAAVPPAIGVVLNISTCRTMDESRSLSVIFGFTTPMLYVLSLLFTLNSRPAISQKFNAPSRKDDEQLSADFQFANSQALNQECRQLDTGKTTVVLTTVPEQAYMHGPETRRLPEHPAPLEQTRVKASWAGCDESGGWISR